MLAQLDEAIEQIVQSVFATMANIDLQRADSASVGGESLLATVHIAGAWTGTVVLSLSQELAGATAAGMLMMPEAEVSDGDRRDTASELANMVGGNLKSVLPAPSYLSLPTIVSGRDLDLSIAESELIDDVSFQSPTGGLNIRLFVQLEGKAHA